MILASDFDNTLYVSDINIVNKNIESINKFRKKGNLFVIITGRGINSVKKYIDEYNMAYDYLICDNGAMIFDNEDNLLLGTCLLEKDISTIIKIIKRDNLGYIFDTGYEYFDNINFDYSNLACIFLDRKTISDSSKLLDEILNSTETYSYISKNWINIVSLDIDKEKALIFLDNYLDNKYTICTIGDAVNDITMIKRYNGAVMKNHEKQLDSLKNKNYETLADYIEELI